MGVGKGCGRFQAVNLGLVCLLLVLGRSTSVESFDLFNSIFGGIDPIDSEDSGDMDDSLGEGFKKELSASAAGAGSASLSLDKSKGIGAGGSLAGSLSFGKSDGDSMPSGPMMDQPQGQPMMEQPHGQPMPMGPPPPMPPPNNYVREPQPGWAPPPPRVIYSNGPHPNSVRNHPPPPGYIRNQPERQSRGPPPPPPPRYHGPPPPQQYRGPPPPPGHYNAPPPQENSQHYRNIPEGTPEMKAEEEKMKLALKTKLEECKNIKNGIEREKCLIAGLLH